MYLTPAQYIIKVFGGVRKAARIIGRDPGAVVRWKKSKSKGGCGGHIPSAAQRIILSIAKKRKLKITPEILTYGKSV